MSENRDELLLIDSDCCFVCLDAVAGGVGVIGAEAVAFEANTNKAPSMYAEVEADVNWLCTYSTKPDRMAMTSKAKPSPPGADLLLLCAALTRSTAAKLMRRVSTDGASTDAVSVDHWSEA